jgi:hypothetical protein
MIKERARHELPTTVYVEGSELSPGLTFCPALERHERRHGLILAAHQENSHIPAQVIDEEEEELVATWGHGCHQATQVIVH